MAWQPVAERTRLVSQKIESGKRSVEAGPHVALGLIAYPALPAASRASDGTTNENGAAAQRHDPSNPKRQKGVLIYIKSSLSGDENDYVVAYKAAHPTFPHESTMDQLFSEEQLECYRALGEHIGRRMMSGEDKVSVAGAHKDLLLGLARRTFPNIQA